MSSSTQVWALPFLCHSSKCVVSNNQTPPKPCVSHVFAVHCFLLLSQHNQHALGNATAHLNNLAPSI